MRPVTVRLVNCFADATLVVRARESSRRRFGEAIVPRGERAASSFARPGGCRPQCAVARRFYRRSTSDQRQAYDQVRRGRV